jgi:hypothetical protein
MLRGHDGCGSAVGQCGCGLAGSQKYAIVCVWEVVQLRPNGEVVMAALRRRLGGELANEPAHPESG